MINIDKYERTPNCHLGEVNGYGYAFVPGSKQGVVLLDMETKNILEDLSLFRDKNDARIKLLAEKGLLSEKGKPPRKIIFSNESVRSMGIWLHVTNKCNLGCPYCYIANKDKEPMSYKTADVFLKKLEKTVKKHRLKSVAIRLAGGEPLLNRKLIEYIADQLEKRLQSKDVQVKLVLLTNGTVFDNKTISMIKRYNVRVCLSLDGLGKFHNATRSFRNGRGSFDKVRKNLFFLLKNGIKPTILTTITERNIKGIPKLSRFLIDNNLAFRYGLYRDNIGGYQAREEFMNEVFRIMNDCYDYYQKTIVNNGTSSEYQFCELHLDRKPHLRSCNIGYSGVTVDHLGDVYVCQAKIDKKPIGNIRGRKTLLEMAWTQKALPDLNEKNASEYKGCQSCQWLLSCAGGCSITNFGVNGTVASASPYCELFKKVLPNLIKAKALRLIRDYGTIRENEKKGGGAVEPTRNACLV